MRHATFAAALVASFAAHPAHAADPAQVPYPAGYRTWAHVKTMQILPGHPLHAAFGGVHHVYANAKALEGYRTGRWADGAVIVFDLLEANAVDNTVGDGARKVVGVMHRDAARYASTGGWGFEGFKGDSRTERAVGPRAAEACFGCHLPQKARGYVFSAWKD